ncbi:Two-component response regulator-like PRR73 [Capsicum chinense]|nr:Two-component response regulator-like PRR73 [Capsicum chinense]
MGEAAMMASGGGGGDDLCLPKMVLRVLLVEADDCTRQIIAALLRKCSYRVAAVPDGLKAWETLKERPHNIDLVLTEVELPSISGYALLTLIVEHDMCKNIPVIMMSSKDSISTVLKCMVKGASDFLIKPVRKNELRNLWQHVWRRKTQHSRSSPETKVVENEKIVAASENDTASNYSSDNLASGQRGNDKGCEVQDVTNIRHRDASNMCNDGRPAECVEIQRSFVPKSKPLANMTSSGMRTSSGTAPDSSVAIGSEEGTLCAKPRVTVNEVQQGCYSANTYTADEVHRHLNELYSAPYTEAVDLMGNFENHLADSYDHSHDSREKSNLASRLELSLGTFNHSCLNDEASWEQNMISQSKASAFSKYENKKTVPPLFSGWTSNSAPLKEGSSASAWQHDESLTASQENETALVMRQPGNCRVATSGTQVSFIPVDKDIHIIASVSNTQSGSQQVQGSRSQSPLPSSSLTYSTSGVQNLEHDKQPFDDTTVQSEDNAGEADNRNLGTVEKTRYDTATCESSDTASGVKNKLSSSHCGSISDEAVESSFPVASPERAPVSESVNHNDILIHDRTRSENHNTSQREAVLMKFRLKRKDRCYEKKVRYESRKRLAEQRPRVKGQFVRQLQDGTQPSSKD